MMVIASSFIFQSSSNGVLAIPARVISTSFALLCFALTLCVGLYNDNAWSSILLGALMAGFIAWLVGIVLGALMLRSVNDNIKAYQADHPIPDEDESVQTEVQPDTPQVVSG